MNSIDVPTEYIVSAAGSSYSIAWTASHFMPWSCASSLVKFVIDQPPQFRGYTDCERWSKSDGGPLIS